MIPITFLAGLISIASPLREETSIRHSIASLNAALATGDIAEMTKFLDTRHLAHPTMFHEYESSDLPSLREMWHFSHNKPNLLLERYLHILDQSGAFAWAPQLMNIDDIKQMDTARSIAHLTLTFNAKTQAARQWSVTFYRNAAGIWKADARWFLSVVSQAALLNLPLNPILYNADNEKFTYRLMISSLMYYLGDLDFFLTLTQVPLIGDNESAVNTFVYERRLGSMTGSLEALVYLPIVRSNIELEPLRKVATSTSSTRTRKLGASAVLLVLGDLEFLSPALALYCPTALTVRPFGDLFYPFLPPGESSICAYAKKVNQAALKRENIISRLASELKGVDVGRLTYLELAKASVLLVNGETRELEQVLSSIHSIKRPARIVLLSALSASSFGETQLRKMKYQTSPKIGPYRVAICLYRELLDMVHLGTQKEVMMADRLLYSLSGGVDFGFFPLLGDVEKNEALRKWEAWLSEAQSKE